MRRIGRLIKAFFRPAKGSSRWRILLPYVVLGVLTLSTIGGSVEVWAYTNSAEFCGTSCHTMPPEYSAYQRSVHARVQCVECHLGRDVVTTQFSRKVGDLRHVIVTLTRDYEFPIYAHQMRPARDSCERCHFPEKFSDDSLRELVRFNEDESNTEERTYLILKTGGGSEREGLGRGIHWHIENEVYYYATDDHEQEIPYIRAIDADGNLTEYYDIEGSVTPDDVTGLYLERMDCITCHNRITHSIPGPEEAVDLALFKGLISNELPNIRAEAVNILVEANSDTTTAEATIESLPDYYQTNYPAVYADSRADIDEAVQRLIDIYNESVYPELKLDWNTHADNLGHLTDPGCFRCHDGLHMTGEGKAIRIECNLCHSIPVRVGPDQLVTEIELAGGPEPPSHTHSNWIVLHGHAIDSSCAACHQPNDPTVDLEALEGVPPADGSFCGNSACHSSEWEYAGFDSPVLAPYLVNQLYVLRNTSPYLLEGVPLTYEGTFRALLDGRCSGCHGAPEYKADMDLSTYAGLMAGGKNGPLLDRDNPAASLLIQRQSEDDAHPGQMLADELEAFQNWIAAGLPEQ